MRNVVTIYPFDWHHATFPLTLLFRAANLLPSSRGPDTPQPSLPLGLHPHQPYTFTVDTEANSLVWASIAAFFLQRDNPN